MSNYKILILICLFYFFSIEIQAQINSCITCSPQTTTNYTKNMTIPQFPSCGITVTYSITTCPNSSVKFFNILSYDFLNNGNGCEQFIAYWVKRDTNGNVYIDFPAFYQTLIMIYDEVALEEFENADPDDYQCPNSYYSASYKMASCLKLRIVLYSHGLTFGIRCFEIANCNNSGCCAYVNKYCYDYDQNIVIEHQDTESGSCETITPNPFTCSPQAGDIVFDSQCFYSCTPRP